MTTLVPAQAEMTLRFTEVPEDVETSADGNYVKFALDCAGLPLFIEIKRTQWSKLEDAAESGQPWTAMIKARIKRRTHNGFAMCDAGLVVYPAK